MGMLWIMDNDSGMNWIHWLFVQSFNITLRLFLLYENKHQSLLLSNFYPSAAPPPASDALVTKY